MARCEPVRSTRRRRGTQPGAAAVRLALVATLILAGLALAARAAFRQRPADMQGHADLRPGGAPAVPEQIVQLPGLMSDAVLAGGGRYLLAPVPRVRAVAVIDLASARVARYLPIDADVFLVAGGATKALVQLPETNQLQRWDLASGRLEASAPLPAAPGWMAMGAAAEGPLLVGRTLIDVARLRRLDVPERHRTSPAAAWRLGFGSFGTQGAARARADGRVFAVGPTLLEVTATGADAHAYDDEPPAATVESLLPSAHAIGWPGDPRVTRRGYPADAVAVPAVQPEYVVIVSYGEFTRSPEIAPQSGRMTGYRPAAAVHGARTGDAAKRFDLPAMPEMFSVGSPEVPGLPLAKRVVVDLDAARMVTIPPSNDRVIVRTLTRVTR